MPASDLDSRLTDFCAWLARHGVRQADSYRPLVRGIYLLPASGTDVGPEHVAQSVAYARDSGADERTQATVGWLGEQLLLFEEERRALERHGGPATAESPAEATTGMAEAQAAADDGEPPPPISGSQPLEVLGGEVAHEGPGDRQGQGGPRLEAPARAAVGDEGPVPAPGPRALHESREDALPEPGASDARAPEASRRPSVPVLAAGVVGLVGAAAAALWFFGAADEPAPAIVRRAPARPAAAAPAPATPRPESASVAASAPAASEVVVSGQKLAVALPPGWHLAPAAATRNPIAAGAQLYRGASPDAPERTVWLSVLPLPAALTGAQITPETLAIVGSFVEEELAEAWGPGYRGLGCGATGTAAPTVVCTATVEGGEGTAAGVRTYVRFDDFRALVAVFVAPLGAGAGPAEGDGGGGATDAETDAEADQLLAAVRDAVRERN